MTDARHLQHELAAALGAACVIGAAQDMAPFLTDWRGRYTGRALAVVQPRTTAQVAAAVRWCASRGIPMVPQGGNTGLVGGATPDGGGGAVVVSTRLLDRVRAVDVANDTLTAEAGCLLQHVQEAARAHERLFPLSLASEGSCTIGGNLASNAGGTQVLRYGNARELTLGLEVVRADGSIWNGLRGLRKDNSGYDLKQLFIGSEGTLGIITAATLRLFPLPRAQVTALVALPDIGAAIGLLERARASAGAALTAFELMSGIAVDLVARTLERQRVPFAVSHPWIALLEWSDQDEPAHAQQRCERLCAAALDAGLARDAVVSNSLADCAAMWRLRESIPEAQARAGGNVKHDIALPLQEMEAFISRTGQALALAFPQLQVVAFGHLGDGNLHYNVGPREGYAAADAFALEARINDIVFEAVQRHGGSFSAEHGVGQLRRDLAQRVKDPLELEMMRSIKRALDPLGLMNPGKVI
jgi:FAD/FMN-containing dehydrogenase